jgi:hypothetical protein
MPLCNTRNETAGIATSCCTESNCNQVITPAVVSRCYVGGTFKDANADINVTTPIVSQQCLPPNNKYCQVKFFICFYMIRPKFSIIKNNWKYVNGVWSVGNDYEIVYYCSSQCVDKTDTDFKGECVIF